MNNSDTRDQRKEWTPEEFRNANLKAAEYALHALTTNGAHHKQWYLERIVEVLGVDLEHFKEATGYDAERGIAP